MLPYGIHKPPTTTPKIAPAVILATRRLSDAVPDALFLNRRTHQLLVGGLKTPFWMGADLHLRPTRMKAFFTALKGVDFARQRMYDSTSESGAFAGGLMLFPFNGRSSETISLPNSILSIVPSPRSRTTYALFFPASTDVTEPKAFVEIWRGGFAPFGKPNQLRRVTVGVVPRQIAASPSGKDLYLVYDDQVKTLSGRHFALSATEADHKVASSFHSIDIRAGVKTVWDFDATERSAYYVHAAGHTLCKIRLSDGKLLASRRLPFAPTALAVDNAQKTIYVASTPARMLARVRLF